MAVNKLTSPISQNDLINKTNEIIDNLGGGGANTDLSNLTATGEAHFLKNTATGTDSLEIGGTTESRNYATSLGERAETNNNYCTAVGASSVAGLHGLHATAIGYGSAAYYTSSIAIGKGAIANANRTIQLGEGNSAISSSFFVGFGSSNNYQLLNGSTGLIPDARISSNIARTSQIPSTTGFLQNTATGTSSLTVLGTSSTANSSINIGVNSQATGSDGVAIGVQANANSNFATAIGYGAKVTGSYGIQLGYGTNSTGHFYVGFNNSGSPQNYKMLDRSTGLIPDERLNNSKFDGQWEYKSASLSTATAISNNSLLTVINNYLPNRLYTYEILCTLHLSRSDSSGTNSFAMVYDSYYQTEPTATGDFAMVQLECDGANFQQVNCAFTLIVKPASAIYYKIFNYKLNSSFLYALAYRRVGTNS